VSTRSWRRPITDSPATLREDAASYERRNDRNALLLVLAAVELAVLLALPAPPNPDRPGVFGGIRTAAAQLRGAGPPIDLVQDYEGARKLAAGHDPYMVLTQAFANVGLVWRADHRSTHPPSAFLLVLPLAWLPWKVASAVWGALMLAAIGGAWWALGARPAAAAALAPLALLWPPAAWSLGQLTPLWLLGLALAWRLRASPRTAGAAVGLASLPKLLPAIALVPLLALGRRRALLGFGVVWAPALVLLLVLNSGALTLYFHIASHESRKQAARGENSALLWAAAHNFGVFGVAVALILVAAVAALSLQRMRGTRRLDRPAWDVWSWIGVALLPIAWIYSLLPLLPALVRIAHRGTPWGRPLALIALAIPYFIDPFGLPGGVRLAICTALLGLALLIETRRASEP
jgi:Glycosyltransferase family 87